MEITYILGGNLELIAEIRVDPAEPDVGINWTSYHLEGLTIKSTGEDFEEDDIYIKRQDGSFSSLEAEIIDQAILWDEGDE